MDDSISHLQIGDKVFINKLGYGNTGFFAAEVLLIHERQFVARFESDGMYLIDVFTSASLATEKEIEWEERRTIAHSMNAAAKDAPIDVLRQAHALLSGKGGTA